MFDERAEVDVASVQAWDGVAWIYRAIAKVGGSADSLKYTDAIKGRKLDNEYFTLEIENRAVAAFNSDGKETVTDFVNTSNFSTDLRAF